MRQNAQAIQDKELVVIWLYDAAVHIFLGEDLRVYAR